MSSRLFSLMIALDSDSEYHVALRSSSVKVVVAGMMCTWISCDGDDGKRTAFFIASGDFATVVLILVLEIEKVSIEISRDE
mmetsp:Transcript_2469/g.2769  ORF Transcript_2469/g.2769 Transcript_2469/m.2769 type:complete len:81 (+) Transcript_2469:476-718(+)